MPERADIINQINQRGDFRLSGTGLTRAVGLPAIAKEKNGHIASVGRTELPEEQKQNYAPQLGRLLAWVLPRGGDNGLAEVGAQTVLKRKSDLGRQKSRKLQGVPPTLQLDSCLLNTRAKKFKEIARAQDGALANGFITPEVLVVAGHYLRRRPKPQTGLY